MHWEVCCHSAPGDARLLAALGCAQFDRLMIMLLWLRGG